MARRVLLVVNLIAIIGAAVVLLGDVSGASVAAVGVGGPQVAGGALDPTFGSEGKVLTRFWGSEGAYGVAVQSDGKIVAVGSMRSFEPGHASDFALARYTTGGNLDASFGRGGRVLADLGGGRDNGRAVAMQADGKILVAGSSDVREGNGDFALLRYTRDGTLDASFGKAGKILTDLGGKSLDDASALTVQKDGKILVAGRSWNKFALVRYTASGKLDASFGRGGKVLANLGSQNSYGASAVAVQKDWKIVFGGPRGDLDRRDFALLRYTTDGRPDVSFGSAGTVLTDFGAGRIDWLSGLAVQTDGKIVAAGHSYTQGSGGSGAFALVRYTAGGKLDASFGSGGKVLTNLGAKSYDIADAVVVQTDGKIVAAGYSSTVSNRRGDDIAVVRYTSQGKLDTIFGSGGKVLTNIGGWSDKAYALAVQKDGKIVVAGTTDVHKRSGVWKDQGDPDFAAVRYTK